MQITSQHINSSLEILALTALFLPLLSALITWLVPARYSRLISFTASALLFMGVIAAGLLFCHAWHAGPYVFNHPWFKMGNHVIPAGIHIDSLSVLMVLVVAVISFLVHVYSIGYMAGDAAIRRYFVMLGFFTFSMQGLVLSGNLLMIFMCWELVGFSSYMLIGHWTHDPLAGMASKKAFIINRIGDVGFLVGLMIIWSYAGTFQVSLLEGKEMFSWQTAAALCLFCGIAGKSAQFPLLTWLPDAMAGPTPVSALIHAATMVAAGVFLLARVFFLFTPEALDVVAIIGIITALIGAVSALFQFDLKKILAYSTISQLGLMILAMGTGSKDSAMLHLFTHAFFKAGLFLAAGSIIHALHQAQQRTHLHFDVQDIRNLGGLRKSLPVTFLVFVICGAALAGVPFFSGFQSKDAILAGVMAWAGNSAFKWVIVVAAFAVSFLTVCYTMRLIWFVFIRKNNETEIREGLVITESPLVMRLPMLLLVLCSGWWIVSWNPFSFSGWYHSFNEGAHTGITIFSAAWVLFALFAAWLYFRNRQPAQSFADSGLSNTLLQAFWLDKLYERVLARPVQHLALLTDYIDRKWIDGALHLLVYAQVTLAHLTAWCDRVLVDGSVNGIAYLAGGIGAFIRSFQGGKIQYYIFWAVLGLIILLTLMVF